MISLAISTYNRREMVLRLLRALERLDVDEEFEALVVVDGSTDGTAEAIGDIAWSIPVRVFTQPNRGLNAARNRGASEARGEAIVFLDDDIVPDPGFLREIVHSLEDGADLVVPLMRTGSWVPDVLLAREMRVWDARVESEMRSGTAGVDAIHFCATALRRNRFHEAGGFDPAFTAGGALGKDETEFAYRLLEAGCRVAWRPDLVVECDCVTDPAVALRRGRDYGRNDTRFARKHPELIDTLLRRPPDHGRIFALVREATFAAPRLAHTATAPIRRLAVEVARRGGRGPLAYRLWLVAWASEWAAGVVEANGRELVRSRR